MKELKLMSLRLTNFKGVKSFTLQTDGQNVSVWGDNATGKTTLYDAFLWLLFDKDSQNRKDFAIKTLDESGEAIHGLDHEVQAVLDIDGKKVTLKKSYKEKWTKKRGSASPEFTGHTTDYFINAVPVKKSEYDDKTTAIADEDIFKLLTNPSYFNEQLKWQDRRKVLLEVAGDVTDEEVIEADKSLAKLPGILGDRTIEDHRKVIASQRSHINKELERIPVRVDEVNRALPDVSGIDAEELERDIEIVKDMIKQKQAEIQRIESGGEIAEKTKKLREVEAEILELRNSHRIAIQQELDEKRNEYYALKDKVMMVTGEENSLQRLLTTNQNVLEKIDARLKRLRESWHQANSETFHHQESDTCAACGQSLPHDKVSVAHERALAQFNRQKAEKLEAINQEGKRLKAEADDIALSNEQAEQKLKDITASIETERQVTHKLTAEIEHISARLEDYSTSQAYQAKLEEKQEIEAIIEDLRAGNTEEIEILREVMNELRTEIRMLENRWADVAAFNRGEERIEELKAQERKLAKEFEQLEQELYLTEEFVRTKVRMLEEKINSRFELARFKLFEEQINGGLAETCETIYKGVPYGSGLNNAARINVGLDIINTLSEHYGFRAPIFVDNAEAVVDLLPVQSQMIRLVVSGADKSLRVETETNKIKEAV